MTKSLTQTTAQQGLNLTMAALLTESIARQIYQKNKEGLSKTLEITKRTGYHILIGTSALGIIFELSVNVSKWKGDYKGLAINKFNATLRTRLSMGIMLDHMPHLLMPGDPKFRGSFIENGFIVAISGLEEQDDENHAEAILIDINHFLTDNFESLLAA